jgi:hypothetical protein
MVELSLKVNFNFPDSLLMCGMSDQDRPSLLPFQDF